MEPSLDEKRDPLKFYGFDQVDGPQYDVIVIGDISAQQFSFGDDKVFAKIKELVQKKTGLLMLGGTETFGSGGWQNHPEFMSMMPVKFDKAGFVEEKVLAVPTPDGSKYAFLQLDPDPKKNAKFWKKQFEELDGLAGMGTKVNSADELIKGTNGQPIMIAGKKEARSRRGLCRRFDRTGLAEIARSGARL